MDRDQHQTFARGDCTRGTRIKPLQGGDLYRSQGPLQTNRKIEHCFCMGRGKRNDMSIGSIRPLALAVLLLLLGQAPETWAQMKKLKVKDFTVKSVTPKGLRTVEATVELELVNAGKPLRLQDVGMTVYHGQKPYVTGICTEIQVPAGTSAQNAHGTFQLSEGVSLWEALRALMDPELREYTADLSLTALGEKGFNQSYNVAGISISQITQGKADAQVSVQSPAADKGKTANNQDVTDKDKTITDTPSSENVPRKKADKPVRKKIRTLLDRLFHRK